MFHKYVCSNLLFPLLSSTINFQFYRLPVAFVQFDNQRLMSSYFPCPCFFYYIFDKFLVFIFIDFTSIKVVLFTFTLNTGNFTFFHYIHKAIICFHIFADFSCYLNFTFAFNALQLSASKI